MKKCNKKCQSNRDGICLGNWMECPEHRVKKGRIVTKICLLLSAILIIAVLLYVGVMATHNVIAEAPDTEPEKQVWKGEYTIFQYTQNGWANHFFVTEFYIEDGFLYYKLRDHQEEYMPIKAEDYYPAPGWIEDIDTLMQYGFWEPAELDW